MHQIRLTGLRRRLNNATMKHSSVFRSHLKRFHKPQINLQGNNIVGIDALRNLYTPGTKNHPLPLQLPTRYS